MLRLQVSSGKPLLQERLSVATFDCSINNYSLMRFTPVHVSDWLIFCCGNLILHQKRNENDENTNFMMKNKKTNKQPKKAKKKYMKVYESIFMGDPLT